MLSTLGIKLAATAVPPAAYTQPTYLSKGIGFNVHYTVISILET